MKYLILPLLLLGCSHSPIYENHTCFQVKKSILHIELVTKKEYFISINRKGWKGALLEGLVPHEELEKAIAEEQYPQITCTTIRSKQ